MGGRKNGIKGHSASHFQIISESPCAMDWNLVNRWAGLCSPLLDFGLGGWLLGHFFSCVGPPWITSVVGLWASGGSLGVGSGPWWTEKIGLYSS